MAIPPLGPIGPERPALRIVRGQGPFVYDADGRAWMDLTSGLMVNVLGHRHPAVERAVARQVRRHAHVMVYGVWPAEVQVRWARRLKTLLPEGLTAIYPTNSGTEAIEGALKTAYVATGRRTFVAFEGAYHGETQGALALIGSPAYRIAFQWMEASVLHLPWDDPTALEAIDERVAAVVVEPVQGEGGIRTAGTAFWRTLQRRCRAVGALLIVDEVQTGLGRCGAWWACQRLQLRPDILVLGKALGGGFPLGAFALRSGLAQALLATGQIPHLSTFGGHPVACAASLAVIRVIRRQRLIQRVQRLEARWRRVFERWGRAYSTVLAGARGLGLMWGLVFHRPEQAEAFLQAAQARGYLMDRPLFEARVVRFAPPYILTPAQVQQTQKDLEAILKELAVRR